MPAADRAEGLSEGALDHGWAVHVRHSSDISEIKIAFGIPPRGVPGRRPGSRTAWPGSSANDGRRGRSGERPDRPACAVRGDRHSRPARQIILKDLRQIIFKMTWSACPLTRQLTNDNVLSHR